ncbi:MAG: type II secretion system protein, partial [Lachnospiraceae bacterium]|nr:type II secretion system protein [Lachnospiraceae bacterium]
MTFNLYRRKNRKYGFTMAELLIAVVIIVILLGLASGFFISIQRNVRQKQMDDIAQEIYMVAQNEMMRVRYTGQLDAFNTAEVDNGVKTLKYAPSDSNVATQMANGTVKLNYISAADSVVAGMMLPSGALDEGIRANKWIIEYDSLSGTVYSVFYSEKVDFTLPHADSADVDYVNATSYPNVTYDQLRDNPDGSSNAGTRKSKTKGYIGYYGRGSAWGEEAKDLDVSMFVDNAEELTLFISYNEPMIKSGATTVSDPIRSVELVVTDLDVSPAVSWSLQADAVGSGTNTDFQNYVPNTVPVTLSKPVKNAVTNRLETGLVLDSILNGKGFNDITGMNVGDNISITLKVTTNSGIIGETTVKTNSGFESKTVGSGIDNDTITVSYGRHLQNLNDYISTKYFDVKQTKDILFGEVTGDASTWYAKYFLTEGIKFVPLHVPDDRIKSFDGSSDGQDFLISDMILEAKDDNGNTGMFGTFPGESLKNIRMVNTQIDVPGAASSVGCIAGETDSLKTLENCYVYLTDEFASSKAQSPYDITKVPYFIQGGKNTGSLIGKVSGTQDLAVTNCFGSTSLTSVINESDAYAGGLFGFVGAGKVTIRDSYADSYVKGYNTAGLVGGIAGNQALDIAYCYTAGFNYTYGHSAGFVLGTSKNEGKVEASDNANANLTMAHAYSIVYQAVDKDVTLASVTKDFITNVKKSTLPADNSVFYCGTATDIRCQGSPVSTMDNAAFLTALNGTDNRFAFQDATSTTSPYNLIDNGLTEYTYPVVLDMDYRKNKDVAGGARILHHFGDWKAEFAKGLVYYEKYADNTYGFYGSNTSLLVHDKTIVADGYALAMSENDYEGIKSNPQVSVGFNGGYTAKDLTSADEKTVIFNDTIKVTDAVSGDKYVLVPLDYVIDSKLNALGDQGEFAPEDFFYYAIRLDSDVFYFNPYFAKTAKSVTGEKSATTDGKTLTDSDIKNAELTKSKVRASVRTARQLHELSENKTYWDKEYLGIVQELNIDYTAYRGYSQVESAVVKVNGSSVAGYTCQRIFTEADFSKDGSIMAVQKPIGTGARPFRAQYDGSGCEIFGVYLVDTVVQKANTLIGLFGQNEGIIKNVTLNGNYTLGTSTTNNVYGFSNGNINGSGTSVYMGALVGYNGSHGLIENCAVTGYKPASRITVSDTSSGYSENIQTYQNSYLYIGGMVGANDGTISKCSSDVPKVHVESTAAYVYAGAFTGYNMGSVSNAYAFSRLYGTLDTSLNAYYAGFAGWNSGTIQRAYCATSITVGDRAEKNSFTNNRGTVKDCFFINNVNGSYSGKIYAYYDETPSPVASEITAFEDLASPDKVSIQGFSKVADASATMIHPFNQGEINNVFPYPAVVTRNGETVSIGNWPITANLGEVGVIYWEHEEGGSNAGWYFSAVDSADRKQSTLCEEHDDGGVITEYGYGYFYEAAPGDSKTWKIEKFSHLNLNQDDTENMASTNESAEAALAKAMPGYEFVAYTSGQGEHDLKLTLTQTTSPIIEWIEKNFSSDTTVVEGYPKYVLSTKTDYDEFESNSNSENPDVKKRVDSEPETSKLVQDNIRTTTTTTTETITEMYKV